VVAGTNRSMAKVQANRLHAENQMGGVPIWATYPHNSRVSAARIAAGLPTLPSFGQVARVKNSKPRYTSRVKIQAPRVNTDR
jgi:hypothetical protein